jgi:hypothetical protein
MSTEQVIAIAAEWKQKFAPKGLEVDDSPTGELNGQIISTFMQNNKLEFTIENLNRAVESEKHRFVWQPGTEPKAAPVRPKGNTFNQMVDAGAGAPARVYSHSQRIADEMRDRENAEGRRQAEVARQKAAEQDRLQKAEESQIVFHQSGPRAGTVNHAATADAQRVAREKWAQIRGVAIKPAGYKIPLHPTRKQLMDGTTAELRVWSEDRRKAGLPASIND